MLEKLKIIFLIIGIACLFILIISIEVLFQKTYCLIPIISFVGFFAFTMLSYLVKESKTANNKRNKKGRAYLCAKQKIYLNHATISLQLCSK